MSEYDKLLKFIKYSWKENHAFVKSKALLDFQHLDKEKEVYHFIVAENQETGDFDALVGYIPLSQYDKSLEENGDYWGAIWKRRDDIQNDEINGMGFFVWDRMFRLPNFRSHGAISMSEDAKAMYRARRLPLDTMKQYYILNEEVGEFRVAGNVERKAGRTAGAASRRHVLRWIDINAVEEGSITICYRPMKSVTFFRNRYDRHPIYRYRFLGLYDGTTLQAVLAAREIVVDGVKVLRIVDVIGELKDDIYCAAQALMKAEGYEYVDMLNYGIDTEIICGMGFELLDLDTDRPIIPNYFEPFVRQNVKFAISYKARFPYVAFKGDADQDRPNVL